MIPEDFVTRWLRKEGYGPGCGDNEGGGYTGTNTKLPIFLCQQTTVKDTVANARSVS